jgi:hypothetical protein
MFLPLAALALLYLVFMVLFWMEHQSNTRMLGEPPIEGSECPLHRRVHGAHGWYVCVPGGWWETKSDGGPVEWTPGR